MTFPSENANADETIEMLETSDRRLGIMCSHCARFRYLKLTNYALEDTLSSLTRSLKCSRCGSEEVEAVAVERDDKTGYWPAERS
jgi:Zn finger protein HypA/HybF involved in hydrogenase expression